MRAGTPFAPSPPARASRGIIPLVRPPGAREERAFLRACTRCNDCATACPHSAILPAPSRHREAAGTPMIDAARQPCLMCEDTPCVAACESGALRPDFPRKIAEAHISPRDCLAHQGTFCSVCFERCPEAGVIRFEHGKPRVTASSCTGCGICAHVCPAPRRAILLLPLRTRGEQSGAR